MGMQSRMDQEATSLMVTCEDESPQVQFNGWMDLADEWVVQCSI